MLSMTATAAGCRPRAAACAWLTPRNSRNRHADLHADAGDRAVEHHALAIEFDVANLPVRAAVRAAKRTGRA